MLSVKLLNTEIEEPQSLARSFMAIGREAVWLWVENLNASPEVNTVTNLISLKPGRVLQGQKTDSRADMAPARTGPSRRAMMVELNHAAASCHCTATTGVHIARATIFLDFAGFNCYSSGSAGLLRHS